MTPLLFLEMIPRPDKVHPKPMEVSMLYKPDFESIIPRMEAWWKGEMLDRACVAVYAPNGKPRREVPKPPTLYEQWTNHDYILDRAEAGFETTYFAGEATPMYYPNLGPDLFAALLGGNIEYRETTSWVAPFLDWDNPVSFEINKASFEWKWLMEMYERVKERSRGKYPCGWPRLPLRRRRAPGHARRNKPLHGPVRPP
jgi:hypothetical protein